jgi:hypothetical protein
LIARLIEAAGPVSKMLLEAVEEFVESEEI